MLPSHFGEINVALFLACVVLAVSLTLLFFKKFNAKKRACSIPGLDPRDPVQGNFGNIQDAGSLHQFLVQLHGDYGPLASFWWGKTFVVSFGSPQLFNEVKDVFDRPRVLFEGSLPLIGNKSIQYANGDDGFKKHQLISRSFTHNAVGDYFDCFVELANEVADNWASLPPGQHVPLSKTMLDLSIKVAINCVIGQHVSDDVVKKIDIAYNICWEEMEKQVQGCMLEEGDGRLENFNKNVLVLRDLVKQSIKERRHKKNEDVLVVDSLTESDMVDEEELLDFTVTILIAAFHTTGTAMPWCFYYMMKNPDVEAKVYEELVSILGDETITNQVASQLTYTKQVLDETLRCSVLAPWGGRFTNYDMKIGEYVIPRQTPIILPFGVVQTNEDIWPDPDRFDPDRFSPENSKGRHPMAFQPFGFAGKRKCLGYRFAYAEAFVILSVLVRRFKIHLVEGQVVEPVYGLVTKPADEIWVTVSER